MSHKYDSRFLANTEFAIKFHGFSHVTVEDRLMLALSIHAPGVEISV
jgi:hypothetical protein